MADFLLVVDFFFNNILSAVWNLITSNFVLSFCFMVLILGAVVSLVMFARGTK